MLPDHLSRKFNEIIAQNKLPKIRFHDLRHTAASLFIQDGFSLKEVSEYLGHCDIGTTANIYTHLQYQSKIAMGESAAKRLCEAENVRTDIRTQCKNKQDVSPEIASL